MLFIFEKNNFMKNISIGFICGFFLTALSAFSVVEYKVKLNTAEVNQLQGLYIFSDCKPILDYDYLGTVKSTITFDGQYQSVRDKLIERTKEKYPNADGIILNLKAGRTDRCDVIKFK